jgi:hypothetical protein
VDKKYIVIAVGNEELMFVFPDTVAHKWMFEAAQGIRQGVPGSWSRPYIGSKCVAAGFVTDDGFCHGRSESLGIASRAGVDTEMFERQYRNLPIAA